MWEFVGRVLELGFAVRNKESFGAVRLSLLGVIGGLFLGVCRQTVFPSCWRRTWYLGPNFGGQNQTKPFLGFGRLFVRSLELIL